MVAVVAGGDGCRAGELGTCESSGPIGAQISHGDADRSWEKTKRMQRWAAPVVIGPDGVLYTAGGRSHDRGDTWESCGAVVVADLARAGRVYAAEDATRPDGEEVRLLRVSDDHGETWHATGAILNTSSSEGGWLKPLFCVHPADPAVLYAGGVVRDEQGYVTPWDPIENIRPSTEAEQPWYVDGIVYAWLDKIVASSPVYGVEVERWDYVHVHDAFDLEYARWLFNGKQQDDLGAEQPSLVPTESG